jgi:hypothetical protein
MDQAANWFERKNLEFRWCKMRCHLLNNTRKIPLKKTKFRIKFIILSKKKTAKDLVFFNIIEHTSEPGPRTVSRLCTMSILVFFYVRSLFRRLPRRSYPTQFPRKRFYFLWVMLNRVFRVLFLLVCKALCNLWIRQNLCFSINS